MTNKQNDIPTTAPLAPKLQWLRANAKSNEEYTLAIASSGINEEVAWI